MSFSTFVRGFLDGFTLGWPGERRRPGAPEYLFAQDEDSENEGGCGHCMSEDNSGTERSSQDRCGGRLETL
jgi:hypothetical protein